MNRLQRTLRSGYRIGQRGALFLSVWTAQPVGERSGTAKHSRRRLQAAGRPPRPIASLEAEKQVAATY